MLLRPEIGSRVDGWCVEDVDEDCMLGSCSMKDAMKLADLPFAKPGNGDIRKRGYCNLLQQYFYLGFTISTYNLPFIAHFLAGARFFFGLYISSTPTATA